MTAPSERDLLPCPFCGSAPFERDAIHYNQICCPKCRFTLSQSAMGMGDAAERWNTRMAVPVDAGWRDIATAKKDRTPVLVCDDGIVGEAYFNDDDGSRDGNFYWAQTHWTDSHVSPVYPQYWTPLPAAPLAANEGLQK